MPNDLRDLARQWTSSGLGAWGSLFVLFIAWSLVGVMKGKKCQSFEGKCKDRREVVESILKDVGSWLFILKNFKDHSISMFPRDWITSISFNAPATRKRTLLWKAPKEGSLKLNFDGASKGNPGSSGFGCVVRDGNGKTA